MNISIVRDFVVEDDEVFSFLIDNDQPDPVLDTSQPDPAVQVGSPDTSIITILDEDDGNDLQLAIAAC